MEKSKKIPTGYTSSKPGLLVLGPYSHSTGYFLQELLCAPLTT